MHKLVTTLDNKYFCIVIPEAKHRDPVYGL